MPRATGKDLAEIFGHAPDDTTSHADYYWSNEECPFTGGDCIKWNHDRTICYGACSVHNPGNASQPAEEVIICPLRLYPNRHQTLRDVAQDAFPGVPLYLHKEYQANARAGTLPTEFVVALGQSSGREIQVGGAGSRLSMDWILARIERGTLRDFVGVEVQSIDITGNYRDNWQGYAVFRSDRAASIPPSGHGLNWANVHKRLIPQIIRKGRALHQSLRCKGLYFIVPDAVYRRFEDLIGVTTHAPAGGPGVLSVLTYTLGPAMPHGQIRPLDHVRTERVQLDDFALSFIAGGALLSSSELEARIGAAL